MACGGSPQHFIDNSTRAPRIASLPPRLAPCARSAAHRSLRNDSSAAAAAGPALGGRRIGESVRLRVDRSIIYGCAGRSTAAAAAAVFSLRAPPPSAARPATAPVNNAKTRIHGAPTDASLLV